MMCFSSSWSRLGLARGVSYSHMCFVQAEAVTAEVSDVRLVSLLQMLRSHMPL